MSRQPAVACCSITNGKNRNDASDKWRIAAVRKVPAKRKARKGSTTVMGKQSKETRKKQAERHGYLDIPGFEKPKKEDAYVCRYRAFLRICVGQGLDHKTVLDRLVSQGKIEKKTASNLRNGKAVAFKNYVAIANEVNTDPTALCFLPQLPVEHDHPIRAFADRVEWLIDNDWIPRTHPDTKEPTNVVEWVWQLDDPVLNAIRLTHREEREAYLLLRDEYLLLYEVPVHVQERRLPLGEFRLGLIPKRDILADIELRQTLGMLTLDELQKQAAGEFAEGDFDHIERIRADLPRRIALYERARIADAESYGGDGRYIINEKTVNDLLDADFLVRKIIFPTYQQDQVFLQLYSRSRRLIRHLMRERAAEFKLVWPQLVADNTEALSVFAKSWQPNPPQFDQMKSALTGTLDILREQIRELYDSLTESEEAEAYPPSVDYPGAPEELERE